MLSYDIVKKGEENNFFVQGPAGGAGRGVGFLFLPGRGTLFCLYRAVQGRGAGYIFCLYRGTIFDCTGAGAPWAGVHFLVVQFLFVPGPVRAGYIFCLYRGITFDCTGAGVHFLVVPGYNFCLYRGTFFCL
jgi:hypothetical protein